MAMSRRAYYSRVRCAETGCSEVANYEYDTRREQDAGDRWRAEHPWRCTRHANPDKTLRPDNTERTTVLVASKVRSHRGDGFLSGLFWLEEGIGRHGSGFEHGPGFNAHADDFPEGTRLVITARIEPPAVSS